MKFNFIYTAGLMVLVSFSFAQNKSTQVADKLYAQFEYIDAAQSYLKLTNSDKADGYVYKQLGDCYYNIFNSKEAVRWYSKAVESTQDAETYFRYAQMLKAEGNLSEALKQMDVFASKAPQDARAKAYKNNPSYTNQLKSQGKKYDIKKLDINSENSDFGAQLTNEGELYFTSARNQSRKKNGMNDEPYVDLYKSVQNSDGTFASPTALESVNTKWHDGTSCVSSDGKTLYYATESFNEGDSQKVKDKKLKYSQYYLYKATKGENGNWSKGTALSINSKEYSLRSPSISKDGKTLYFSSDMPGGLGGEDIWKVSVDGDSYGTPENLGSKVNTEANEGFPYIDDKDVLYFSSNGKLGFGGLDLFMIDLKSGESAKNLGEPVNSSKDDFSFTYNVTKRMGYFSSNREGNDDVYSADPVCVVEAIVKVKDAETGRELSDAQVIAMDDKAQQVGSQMTNYSGESGFNLACRKAHSFIASRSGYENGTATMESKDNGRTDLVVLMNPIKVVITDKEVILQPIYFEYDKWNITEQGAQELDKLVTVMQEHPNMVISARSHTDSRGATKYNQRLSERRAKSTMQYVVSKGIDKSRITAEGVGEAEPKVTCQTCTEEEHAQNRRSEFLIIKK